MSRSRVVAGGGSDSRQLRDNRVELALLATAVLLSYDAGLDRPLVLFLRADGAPVDFDVTMRTNKGTRTIPVTLGPGQAVELEVWGALTVSVKNRSNLAVAHATGVIRVGAVRDLPPVSWDSGALNTGGVGVPGAWASTSAPGERYHVSLMPLAGGAAGPVELALVNDAGFTVSSWTFWAQCRFVLPPNVELRVRHPGDANLPAARRVLAAFHRS